MTAHKKHLSPDAHKNVSISLNEEEQNRSYVHGDVCESVVVNNAYTGTSGDGNSNNSTQSTCNYLDTTAARILMDDTDTSQDFVHAVVCPHKAAVSKVLNTVLDTPLTASTLSTRSKEVSCQGHHQKDETVHSSSSFPVQSGGSSTSEDDMTFLHRIEMYMN